MFRLNPDIRNTTLYYAKLFTVGLPMSLGAIAGTVTVFVCLPWYYWAIGLSLCLVAVLVVWHSVAPFCRYLYYRALLPLPSGDPVAVRVQYIPRRTRRRQKQSRRVYACHDRTEPFR